MKILRRKIEVTKDVFNLSGELIVSKGAIGGIGASDYDYRGGIYSVCFDTPLNTAFVAKDGSGRRIQNVPIFNLKEFYSGIGEEFKYEMIEI